jgi:AraC family transcriptional regulator
MNASIIDTDRPQETFETAREWIRLLGGEAVGGRSWTAASSLAIAHFRFRRLEDETEAPALPFHYVSLAMAGSLKIEAKVGGRRVVGRMRSGQSMIMVANRENRWRWNAATEETFVFMRPEFLRAVAEETGTPDCEIRDQFVFEDSHLRRTLQGIITELSSTEIGSALFTDIAAQAIAARLIARHRKQEPHAGQTSLTAPQLKRVFSLIDDRLGEDDIDLAALADAAGTSRFHFLRCFRATTGKSPLQYVTQQRVELAKKLLRDTRLTILDIAGRVGFASQSHFGQVFLRQTGVSPKVWRSQIRSH